MAGEHLARKQILICSLTGNNTQHAIRLLLKLAGNSGILEGFRQFRADFRGNSNSSNQKYQLFSVVHVVSSDTHGGSACGRPGRSREGRTPGTGCRQGPAGADGSHRTGSPIRWNRWHRMTGRLQETGETLTVSPFKYSFPSPYLGFFHGYTTACHNFAGWLQEHIRTGGFFLSSSCADWDVFLVSQAATPLNKRNRTHANEIPTFPGGDHVVVIKMAAEHPSITHISLNAASHVGRHSFCEDEPCFLPIKRHLRLAW